MYHAIDQHLDLVLYSIKQHFLCDDNLDYHLDDRTSHTSSNLCSFVVGRGHHEANTNASDDELRIATCGRTRVPRAVASARQFTAGLIAADALA